MPIEHISDTARWVAVYRAIETERRDAIFLDPFARALAGPRGAAIDREMGKDGATASAVVVRTAVFDELILELARSGRIDVVVNLAAGLDARPWRLPLPPSLRWVDVDLPTILEYKRQVLRGAEPSCPYEAVGADLTDATSRDGLFARLGEAASNALVITEGLLIYLETDQAAALARDLGAVAGFRHWLLDLASPELLRIMNRNWGAAMERGGAPFRFAPEAGTAFFRPFGWREAQHRTFWDESHRLRREPRLTWLWRLMSRFAPPERREAVRQMKTFVLLERSG